jgi:class 3 adenylate cyclase
MSRQALESKADRLTTVGARTLRWAYRKLGRRYPKAFITLELQSAWGVTLGTLGLYTFYYDTSGHQFLPVLLAALALTGASISLALIRVYRRLEPIEAWIAGKRDPEQTALAWSRAVGLPLEVIRRDMFLPIFGVALPGSILAVALLGLSWAAFFPIYAGAMVAIAYSGVLHYFAIESGLRPLLIDIAEQGGPPLMAGAKTMSLRLKLLGALPLINIITGLVVAALSSNGGGASSLGVDVLIATAVAFTVSFELTVLLSRSILRPIRDLEKVTDEVRRGNYDVLVPITTADEVGRLGLAFNQMVTGLAERERLREAFGAYLDKDVAEYILDQGLTPEGREVEVSILICDALDFTAFASRADAAEVVARLNELFERIVPIVARHGGHVDKFIGDGLLAVFGAPEPFEDHADRAVTAAVEMAEVVNQPDSGLLPIGIGVNSGVVVAGSIGGAGRFNFSVIGDAVNIAARVEEATRRLGDDVLITAATQSRLSQTLEVLPRGPQRLKGKDEPVELFAPLLVRREGTLDGEGLELAEAMPLGSAEVGAPGGPGTLQRPALGRTGSGRAATSGRSGGDALG